MLKRVPAVLINVLNKQEILMGGMLLNFSTESVDNSVDSFCNPVARHDFL